jgi:hypothetical protein
MHERIKELAAEAKEYAKGFNLQHEVFERKFAELIIQECMACSTWVGKINTNSVEPVHTAHAINQRIKQQFGVE